MDPRSVVIAWQLGQRSDGRAANEKYLADDIRLVLPGKDPIVGKAACSEHFARVEDSFAPLRVSTVDGPYTVIISEGDLVAHRFRWYGETHDGQLVDLFVFNLLPPSIAPVSPARLRPRVVAISTTARRQETTPSQPPAGPRRRHRPRPQL